MNAGIVCLQDGTPCIVYDEPLPHAVRHVEFDGADHQLTLVYDLPPGAPRDGRRLEFPLDRRFVALLRERGTVAAACVDHGKISGLKLYPVQFI